MVRHRGLVVASVVGAALLVPSAAAALDVDSVTDPLAPIAEDVVDDVNDAVEDATSQGPAKQITDQVDPVLDKVKGPVKDIVDDIVGPVKDVTDPILDDDVIDDVTDGVLGGGGAAGGTRREKKHATAGRKHGTSTAARPGGTAGAAPRTRNGDTSAGVRGDRSAPVDVRATASHQPVPARPNSIAEAITDATRTFAFPLAVAALILLFLAIQHRIDARDPKLAEVLDDDELSFA